MNRIIKFRAWNKKTGEWLHSYKTMGGFSLFGETIVLGGWLSGVSIADFDEIVAQQFTGLKDKLDNEIYEGDIIRFGEYWDGDSRYKAGVAVVKFFDNAFDLEETRHGDWMDLWKCVKSDGGVVVGNIFDNPELLKENGG